MGKGFDSFNGVRQTWIQLYSFIWTNTIYGQILYMDKYYIWTNTIYGQILYMDKYYKWTNTIYGQIWTNTRS